MMREGGGEAGHGHREKADDARRRMQRGEGEGGKSERDAEKAEKDRKHI